jgi:3-deoxy-D-manno-octulosonic-acid transferase
VDEMGFLAELYSIMDWSWVGGGFGSGVHSTIEPAVHGLAVFSGPKGWEKFDEIRLLERQGQLAVLDFASNREGFSSFSDSRKKEWMDLNRIHQGASQRIWEHLERRIDSLPPSVREPFTEA